MAESLGIRKVLVVYSHPAHQCLNGAILDTFLEGLKRAGLEHRLRDLYAMGFNPAPDEKEWRDGFAGIIPDECKREQEHVLWADALVWIQPAWNFSLPAILKGYLDRVFMIPGFSFESDPNGVTYRGGLLKHKKALVLQTLGGGLSNGYRFGNATEYAQALVSSLHYAGIRNTHVTQFWNLYKETQVDSPEIEKVLATVRALAETFDTRPPERVQIVSSLVTPL